MCKVIAIANQKGGAGKTTTTKNLGYALKQAGKKVLLVDFDPQYSLSTCMGVDSTDDEEVTMPDLMDCIMTNQKLPDKDTYIKNIRGVDIILGNLALSATEMKLVGILDREYVLKTIIDEVKREYDYILIDCNPSLGMLVINALAACDSVLIPVDSNFLASKGLELFLGTIIRVTKRINTGIKIDGILLTRYSKNTKISRKSLENIETSYGNHIRIYEAKIPQSVKVGESDEVGKSIIQYAPTNAVSQAYIDFSKEVLAND